MWQFSELRYVILALTMKYEQGVIMVKFFKNVNIRAIQRGVVKVTGISVCDESTFPDMKDMVLWEEGGHAC